MPTTSDETSTRRQFAAFNAPARCPRDLFRTWASVCSIAWTARACVHQLFAVLVQPRIIHHRWILVQHALSKPQPDLIAVANIRQVGQLRRIVRHQLVEPRRTASRSEPSRPYTARASSRSPVSWYPRSPVSWSMNQLFQPMRLLHHLIAVIDPAQLCSSTG